MFGDDLVDAAGEWKLVPNRLVHQRAETIVVGCARPDDCRRRRHCAEHVELGASQYGLEPHVRDAAAVTRQVIERVEAVEVVDGKVSDRPGLGEPQVNGDAAAAV